MLVLFPVSLEQTSLLRSTTGAAGFVPPCIWQHGWCWHLWIQEIFPRREGSSCLSPQLCWYIGIPILDPVALKVLELRQAEDTWQGLPSALSCSAGSQKCKPNPSWCLAGLCEDACSGTAPWAGSLQVTNGPRGCHQAQQLKPSLHGFSVS